jgi:hypothetical protein
MTVELKMKNEKTMRETGCGMARGGGYWRTATGWRSDPDNVLGFEVRQALSGFVKPKKFQAYAGSHSSKFGDIRSNSAIFAHSEKKFMSTGIWNQKGWPDGSTAPSVLKRDRARRGRLNLRFQISKKANDFEKIKPN